MRILIPRSPAAGGCRWIFAPLAGAILAATAAGCSNDNPDLAKVRGTIKLDGAPLPAGLVIFTPEHEGRYSAAETNASGEYELRFTRNQTGVLPGKHTITISTHYDWGGPGRELVPPRYNSKTELTREIEPGSHTIDFDLESGGFGKTAAKKR